jgi:DNA-binding NarL/FixJ family response regulator/REP element-mobilizing transposase RayT
MVNVLMIHREVGLSVSLKQTLERAGGFQVRPFTTPDAAIDYLRENPQDVAIVDFTLPRTAEIIASLRVVQPDIAIIATPRQSENVTAVLNLQGSVEARFSARDLMPIFNRIRNARTPGVMPPPPPGSTVPLPPTDLPELPATRPAKSAQDTSLDEMLEQLGSQPRERAKPNAPKDKPRSQRPLTPRQEKFVEFIMRDDMNALFDEIEQGTKASSSVVPEDVPPPPNVPEAEPDPTMTPFFQRLQDDEPPPPAFEESGTVGDLVTGVSDKSFSRVLSLMRGEEVEESDDIEIARFSDDELAAAFGEQPAAVQPDRLPEATQFEFADESRPKVPVIPDPGATRTPIDGFDLDRYLASLEGEATANRPTTSRGVESFPFEALPEFEEAGQNTARIVLEQALGESTPVDTFSISELISSIESQLPENQPKVQPLPSWIFESEQRAQDMARYVHEPDFLPDTLPEADLIPEPPPQTIPELPKTEPVRTDQFSNQETVLSQGQRMETTPHDDATEWLQPTSEVFPEAPWLPEAETPGAAEIVQGDTEPLQIIDEPFEEAPAAESFGIAEPITDPYIAQLALSLTQVSLEMTAQAALLARDGRIVAYAGQMDRVDMAELRSAIDDDWEAQPRQARIRMITVEGSGKEYMLYSKLTDDGFTLSLIFAGSTPLRDIRRQGKRIIEALQVVPELPPVEGAAPEDAPTADRPFELPTEEALSTDEREALNAAIGMMGVNGGLNAEAISAPYAYVWVLRDPSASIDSATARAIVAGMNVQLSERAWTIHDLQAREGYIYLLADVPGDQPPSEVIRDLKRRAAEIAARQNAALDSESLWADGYLVVTPGRRLEHDEIQQYISFERM